LRFVIGVSLSIACLSCARRAGKEAIDGPTVTQDRPADIGVAPVDQDTPGDRGQTPTDAAVDPPVDLGPAPVNTCRGPTGATLKNARVPPGFCAWVWADNLLTPRGIAVAPNGDLLVIERAELRVTVLFDDNGDFVSGPTERAVLAQTSGAIGGLNHGIALHGGFLYASSQVAVVRWPYRTGQRVPLQQMEVVVKDIPPEGRVTRTPIFDSQGRLYLSVGSRENLDPDSTRARVRRFSLDSVPQGGISFSEGEVFADGLRNTVGLAFDQHGRLWGVENGSDALVRHDVGIDLHRDNPAEELNLFAEPGRFHGYPYCWTEYQVPSAMARGTGTQWAHAEVLNDGIHTDAWCRNPANVVAPALAMPGHVAPLDLIFYGGSSLPPSMRGDAVITWHGSNARVPPIGYKVVRVSFESGRPGSIQPLLEYDQSSDRGPADEWPHRPVGVREGLDGELYISSDSSGVIITLGFVPSS
jgi:glucose/arabinose dehydrogenase